MDNTNRNCYDILIIGGGPAGTGLLMKALKDGARNNFFHKRVALVERSSHLIAGSITQYQVNSDTLSDVFLECLEGATGDVISKEKLGNEIGFVQSHKGKSIPLPKLEPYFRKLGGLLQEALASTGKCEFFVNTTVNKVVRNEEGMYALHVTGKDEPINSRQIVLAVGGVPKGLPDGGTFAQTVSLRQYCDKIIHSDTVLKSGLGDDVRSRLRQNPNVVILGGSHSAFSVAHCLLNSMDDIPFRDGDIQMWSSSLPKIYFNTRDEALANGYEDFGEEDFCPVTGKLYRLAGLRMDGRDLCMHMLGVGRTTREKRVVHNVYTNQETEVEEQLKEASLIVLANGYKLKMIPFFDVHGNEIHFKGNNDDRWVNDNCLLVDENEKIIPNVFASGLATGFIPKGALGGEPSFTGQTNGIWYYQNAIADLIMRNLGVRKL